MMLRGKGHKGKTAILITALLLAVCAGVYFLLMPRIERDKAQAQQDALLVSITQGDGVIAVPAQLAELDFYDPPTDGGEPQPDVIPMEVLPLAVPEAEAAGALEESGVITGLGVLSIEKIDLQLPISEGISEAQLKISPGHVPQTPPIGETGNAVVAGHRSYEYGQHFNRLGELETGDLIHYQSKDGEVMTFAVFDILEITPGGQTAFEQPEDAQIITLYTCTPIRAATHRLLVRAERIS
jgi:LPXTG-site transpeptidase (sortase) family protein